MYAIIWVSTCIKIMSLERGSLQGLTRIFLRDSLNKQSRTGNNPLISNLEPVLKWAACQRTGIFSVAPPPNTKCKKGVSAGQQNTQIASRLSVWQEWPAKNVHVCVTFCKCQYWCSRVRSIPSMARPSTRSITDSQPIPAQRHAGSDSTVRTIAVAAGRGPFSQPKGPTNHGSGVRNRSLVSLSLAGKSVRRHHWD